MSSVSQSASRYFWLLVLSFFMSPIAVGIEYGFGSDKVCLNFLLWFFVPLGGFIHAICVLRKARYSPDPPIGAQAQYDVYQPNGAYPQNTAFPPYAYNVPNNAYPNYEQPVANYHGGAEQQFSKAAQAYPPAQNFQPAPVPVQAP